MAGPPSTVTVATPRSEIPLPHPGQVGAGEAGRDGGGLVGEEGAGLVQPLAFEEGARRGGGARGVGAGAGARAGAAAASGAAVPVISTASMVR